MILTHRTTHVRAADAGTPGMSPTEVLQQNLERFLQDQEGYSRDSYASLLDLIQNTPYSRQLKNIVLRAVHSNFERILGQIKREIKRINPRSADAQHHLPDLQRLKQLFSQWDGFFYEQPPTTEALVDHVNKFRTLIYRGLRVLRAAESYLNISNNDASRLRQLAHEGTE
jgi:hypothetical protein